MDDLDKLAQLLSEQMIFPDYYFFKFVVKIDQKQELLEILGDMQITQKLSTQGNYTSITARKLVHNVKEITEVYEKIKVIKGIMSL